MFNTCNRHIDDRSFKCISDQLFTQHPPVDFPCYWSAEHGILTFAMEVTKFSMEYEQYSMENLYFPCFIFHGSTILHGKQKCHGK